MSLHYLLSQTSYTLFLEQVIVIKGQSSLSFRCLRHGPNVGTWLLKLYARLRIQLRGRHLKLRAHGGTSCQTSPVCPVVCCLAVATTLGTGSWKHLHGKRLIGAGAWVIVRRCPTGECLFVYCLSHTHSRDLGVDHFNVTLRVQLINIIILLKDVSFDIK